MPSDFEGGKSILHPKGRVDLEKRRKQELKQKAGRRLLGPKAGSNRPGEAAGRAPRRGSDEKWIARGFEGFLFSVRDTVLSC